MRYGVLVDFYKELESTTKRLAKRDIIARLLKKTSKGDLNYVVYLLQGRVFPKHEKKEIGFSSQLMVKAIAKASGHSTKAVTTKWRSKGGLGLVAGKLIAEKKQRTLGQTTLTVKKVCENIRKLTELTGAGTVERKINLVAELLTSAKPEEAKFITRTVLREMRIGVAEGVLREAIAKEYKVEVKDVERAYNLALDYAEVCRMAKDKVLGKASLIPGRPTKVMLAIRVESVAEAFKAVGKPALWEYKFDGFRVLIHKKDDKITLISRRMENITNQFPDVVQDIKKHARGTSFILDTEVVGYDRKTGKYLPFQKISQRIRRKYDIEKMRREFPVEVNVFDVLYYNGKNYMKKSQKERHKLLKKIVKQKKNKVVITDSLITSSEKEADKFYKESLRAGNEGVIVKNLKEVYRPGRRVGGWVKFKPTMEPLDLVVVGAHWGEGKRSKWLASFDLACKSGSKFLTIGKVGTGIKEKAEGVTFKQLTKELKPYITETKGKHVKIKPHLVLEVGYEEIQKSPTYTSGYALRFPKLLQIKITKRPRNANTVSDVKRLYEGQKKK